MSGYVYFIQAGDGGPIKIGFAQDPQARLRELSTGSPARLSLLRAVSASGIHQEQMLHRQFGDLRLKGEWFRAEERLVQFIEALPDRLPLPRPPRRYRYPAPRSPARQFSDNGIPPNIQRRAWTYGLNHEGIRAAIVSGDIYLWTAVGLRSIKRAAEALNVDLDKCEWWARLSPGLRAA